ncbi:MAG: hypothetical protein ACREEX_15020 [Caulobacteraceae bacterium]
MTRRILFGAPSALALAVILAAALVGCHGSNPPQANTSLAAAPAPDAALPLSNTTTPPLAPAPTAAALAPTPPPPVRRLADPSDIYAFTDRAAELAYGFGSAPPDYGFDYDGVTPWAWRSNDGYETVAEPLPGGAWRTVDCCCRIAEVRLARFSFAAWS